MDYGGQNFLTILTKVNAITFSQWLCWATIFSNNHPTPVANYRPFATIEFIHIYILASKVIIGKPSSIAYSWFRNLENLEFV
jgi:hypothetical protein